MTYQTLQTPSVSLTSEYVSQGTDEAEMRAWLAATNQPVAEDEDYTEDLEGMGLR